MFGGVDAGRAGVEQALDVVVDPDTGEWVCRAGSGDGCVPWNIFTNSGTQMVVDDYRNGVTQEAIDYLSISAVRYSVTSIDVFNLTFTSDWENYGIALPSASEGVQMAVGAEYREAASALVILMAAIPFLAAARASRRKRRRARGSAAASGWIRLSATRRSSRWW